MKCEKQVWSKKQAHRFKTGKRYTRMTQRKTTIYKCNECHEYHLTTNRNTNIIKGTYEN